MCDLLASLFEHLKQRTLQRGFLLQPFVELALHRSTRQVQDQLLPCLTRSSDSSTRLLVSIKRGCGGKPYDDVSSSQGQAVSHAGWVGDDNTRRLCPLEAGEDGVPLLLRSLARHLRYGVPSFAQALRDLLAGVDEVDEHDDLALGLVQHFLQSFHARAVVDLDHALVLRVDKPG